MFKEMIDRDTFRAIVGNYGANYQGGGLSDGVIDKMLDNHVKGKEHIFKLFGNKLKVEKEVEISIDDYSARDLINDFAKELSGDKKLIFAKSLIKNTTPNEFIKNTVLRDMSIFNVDIKSGTKLSKALMKMVLPEDQHKVSTMHSMINQKLFVKGKVVLSIDPCDYVTMSSNNSGWRSCHRLDGGEYRTGPLAYLNDSSTVICYIESSNACTFNYCRKEYTHTNKVWRQIALVSPELTFAMQERQYPNSNSMNETAVSNLFKELFETYHNKSYRVIEGVDNDDLSVLHIDYASDNDVTNMYYNDTINEMYDEGNVVGPATMTLAELKMEALPLKGADAYCLNCGDYLHDSDTLYCYDCADDDYSDDDEW